MKRNALIVLFLSLFLMCLTATSLFACKIDNTSISLVVEGEATKGAVCKIYAELKGINDYSDIEFFIEEDYDWVSIQGEELLFTQNAEVGKAVTVVVKLGKLEDKKTITVKPTPVTSISVDTLPYLVAGGVYEIPYTIIPEYATDVPVSFEVIDGKELARFEGSELYIDDSADYLDNVTIRAFAGGKTSEIVTLNISTVQPKTLELVSDKYELKRGEQAKITCNVTPANCTLGNAELIIPESEYYSYLYIAKQGIITIKDTAPEGEITINAKLGKLSTSITIKIVKTPVERIDFTSSHSALLKYGDNVELQTEVIPHNATNSAIAISVIEGADYIKLSEDKHSFEVITREVGKLIVIVAEADGVKSNLAFSTEAIMAEGLSIGVSGSVSVKVGEKRTIKTTITPENTTNQNVTFDIVTGEEYAVIQGNEILFVGLSESGKTEVKVKVHIDDIEKFVTFYIVPVPTQSVIIATDSKTTELVSGDTVVFNGIVEPADATYGELTYYIESGEKYGYIYENVFTVLGYVSTGRVVVYAQTQDGIRSNSITLDILGTIDTFRPTTWASLNNNPKLFDGSSSVILDLTSLPTNADYTTVIISDDVDYLELYGAYDRAYFIIENLDFYFLTTDFIDVKMKNVAIVSNGGFNDYVFDFGNYATVRLDIVGNNYIKASSAYMPNSSGYTVDGEISGTSNDYLRKKGMDGFPGLNGGSCINAYNLEIAGAGNLTLIAGSGSNGTDGTNGANATDTVFAGLGGSGGYGGDSGYAIFANVFTCNTKGELQLIGGNGGIGGKGGLGGVSTDAKYNGASGINGFDGKANHPIFVASTMLSLTNNYTVAMGSVVDNSNIRTLYLDSYLSTIEKYYKISIHYASTYMPHSQYTVKALSSTEEVYKMMYALDYALSTFPKNLYLEIMQKTGYKLNIYLTDSITKKLTGGVIYGLTSTINNMWLATFETTLRGVYYSTPFNIITHELFHVLTFALDEQANSSLKSTLPKYNLGNSYTTNSKGVYDPEKGYNGDNSVFLCSYSKSNYSEDISDNLSMIGMLVNKPDYLEDGKPFYKKINYITSVYEGYFDSITPYTVLNWKKFL